MIAAKFHQQGFLPETAEDLNVLAPVVKSHDEVLEERGRQAEADIEDYEQEIEAGQRAILSSSTLDFHRQLAVAVLPEAASDVPRNLPCKEFARVVRAFFKQIGLSGISVRTPNYSMAMGIEIRIPAREDYKRKSDGSFDWLNLEDCPASQSNGAAEKLLSKFMNRHFPNHGNYSDGQIDHFDFRWSIH